MKSENEPILDEWDKVLASLGRFTVSGGELPMNPCVAELAQLAYEQCALPHPSP